MTINMHKLKIHDFERLKNHVSEICEERKGGGQGLTGY